MAPGCFGRLCCSRQSPAPSDDGIVSPAPAPTGANQPSPDPPSGDGGAGDDTTIGVTRPRSPTNPSNADIPVPASTPGSQPSITGVLAPAPAEAQPTGPHSPEGDEHISVPAHAEGVSSASRSSRPSYHLDPAEGKKHIDRIERFRVLVIGRANAGKTTVLQRVCNTTDQPEILSGGGERQLDATVVQGSLTRGHHNIEDELVFLSNPRFVFHDSCGFEAGSEGQFQMMKKFVTDHAKTTKLDMRIHAIWYCIPLNESHRMVMAAEKKFFDECDTGHVPVIVLLTKADTLRLDAVQALMSKGSSVDNAMKEAAEVERVMVDDHLVRVRGGLEKLKFPPCDYVALSGMEQQGADCTCLLQCTGNALSEEGLQELLMSTQQSNLGLCMEFAIKKSLKRWMENTKAHHIEPTSLPYELSMWFPYSFQVRFVEERIGAEGGARAFKFARFKREEEVGRGLALEEAGGLGVALVKETFETVALEDELLELRERKERKVAEAEEEREKELVRQLEHRYDRDERYERDYEEGERGLDVQMDNTLVPSIDVKSSSKIVMPMLAMPMQCSMQYIAEYGISAVIVFEYLYFLLQGTEDGHDLQEDLTLAVKKYETSGVHANVHKHINAAFQGHGEDVEILCPILVDIAKQNQMSKNMK